MSSTASITQISASVCAITAADAAAATHLIRRKRSARSYFIGLSLLTAAAAIAFQSIFDVDSSLYDSVQHTVTVKLPNLTTPAAAAATAYADLASSLFSSISSLLASPTRPGLVAAAAGHIAHSPVVFIPGITSTSLEVWQSDACAGGFPLFRQRLYGGLPMIRSLILDSRCW